MRERFGKTQFLAAKFCNLVPSVLCNGNPISFDDLLSFYKEDLPTSFLARSELLRWRAKWEGQGAEDRPATLRTAIKACDKDIFPNVYALLQLGCTLPVTSCENERANSALKNLKTYLRSTMGQEWLSSLSLMHIHYNFPVDLNDIVDKFKAKCNRRIIL